MSHYMFSTTLTVSQTDDIDLSSRAFCNETELQQKGFNMFYDLELCTCPDVFEWDSPQALCGGSVGHLRECRKTFCGCSRVADVRPVLVLYLYLCEEQPHALDLW